MLRCSTCSRIYQNGTQQFCTNDGGQLFYVDAAVRPFVRISIKKNQCLSSDLSTTKLQPLNSTVLEVLEDLTTKPLEVTQVEWNSNKLDLSQLPVKALEEKENNFVKPIHIPIVTLRSFSRRNSSLRKPLDRSTIAACLFAALLVMLGVAFAGAYFLREKKMSGYYNAILIATSDNFISKNKNENDHTFLDRAIKFHNTKKNLGTNSTENSVSFSLFYPNTWQRSSEKTLLANSGFFNITNLNKENFPTEQLSISFYESHGSFEADHANFPILAEKFSTDYAQKMLGFERVFGGSTTINKHLAYEIRFKSKAINSNDQTVQIWGRTIFLPVEKEGAQNGLAITILATPLGADLSWIDDVGNKGELLQILETIQFEN